MILYLCEGGMLHVGAACKLLCKSSVIIFIEDFVTPVSRDTFVHCA